MSDRELLEAAAKVAGIDGEFRTEHLCVNGDWDDVTAIFLADGWGWWNPLTDDGDVLRLAVQFALLFSDDNAWHEYYGEELAMGRDVLSATRRAIVRAVAAMKEKT